MPDVAERQASPSATCHVAVLATTGKAADRAAAWTATSATLGEEDLVAVREAAAVWRDWKYARTRLQKLISERGWPGFVLVYNIKRRLVPPPPLDMPIEPLELNEGNPAVRAIAERGGGQDAPSETSAAFRASRRVLARVGTGFIGMISPLINGIVGLAMRNWTQFYINAGIMALGVGVFAVVWWVTSAQWYIVPGGLIRRRGVLGTVGVQLTPFRPADTLVVVRPFPPAGWSVSLTQGERLVELRVTTVELTALLAAWQSLLPCPPLEQLADLR